jgi:hypothetical protein
MYNISTYKYVLQVCILVLHVYILVLQVCILVLQVCILVLQVYILVLQVYRCTYKYVLVLGPTPYVIISMYAVGPILIRPIDSVDGTTNPHRTCRLGP